MGPQFGGPLPWSGLQETLWCGRPSLVGTSFLGLSLVLEGFGDGSGVGLTCCYRRFGPVGRLLERVGHPLGISRTPGLLGT